MLAIRKMNVNRYIRACGPYIHFCIFTTLRNDITLQTYFILILAGVYLLNTTVYPSLEIANIIKNEGRDKTPPYPDGQQYAFLGTNFWVHETL